GPAAQHQSAPQVSPQQVSPQQASPQQAYNVPGTQPSSVQPLPAPVNIR
ncbi:MAG: hypothetical protein JWP21_1858, partial [Tardiphaga sp.]|nr:hypothetical protein [Tardiphaga sp.]